jgi:hypothetical protein
MVNREAYIEKFRPEYAGMHCADKNLSPLQTKIYFPSF